MAEILQTPKREIKKVIKAIERYLRGETQYELMHALLRQAVEAELPRPKENYLQKLLDWCKSYQERKWPEDTPDYILHNYADHFVAANDLACLYALLDKSWMQRKCQEPKLLASFAEDMEKLSILAGHSNPINWLPLIRSCLVRATVTSFHHEFHYSILLTLVYIGQYERASHFADLIQDKKRQEQAHDLILDACIEIGDLAAAQIVAEKQAHTVAQSPRVCYFKERS